MKENNPLESKLAELQEKYGQTGQDMSSYLEGLLLSNYLPYWEYIRLDTLLSLQQPRTDFPDEQIFIMYHQITELYFKLCLHELEQIANNGRDVALNGEDRGWKEELDPQLMIDRLKRVNAYFDALTKSFEIMVNGMEKEQFLKFRMALLPASGFQSAQYRMIELACTPIKNLLRQEFKDSFKIEPSNEEIESAFDYIYWKRGAIEVETGKKTYTLKQFEKKYQEPLIEFAQKYKDRNVWMKYLSFSEEDQQREDLIAELRNVDLHVNVKWPLMHYKSAVRYLHSDKGDTAATGGTNWQKYLPPRHQRRIFYPELFTEEELNTWGTGKLAEIK